MADMPPAIEVIVQNQNVIPLEVCSHFHLLFFPRSIAMSLSRPDGALEKSLDLRQNIGDLCLHGLLGQSDTPFNSHLITRSRCLRGVAAR